MVPHRKPRGQPFLNDPAAYPEFALLIERQGLQHALRSELHRHRTAALLVLVALSIAASGADVPIGSANGDGGGVDWKEYLAKGINVPLLERHFEGIVSALGCMSVVTAAALLAYPIFRLASPATNQNPSAPSRWYRSSVAAGILAAAAPSVVIWVVAIGAAGLYRWGIASGLCVGLQCASLSLKSVSFMQQACLAADAAPSTSNTAGTAAAAATAAAATGAVASAPPAKQQQKCHGDDEGGKKSDGDAASAALMPPPALTFAEFAFFLLAAPSLVCEPRLLLSSARLPRRFGAAASEFLHAGLAYLAVHVTCSAFFAPTLRVLAAALHSGGGGGWADEDDWAELHRASGSGWWLYGYASRVESGGGCGGGEGGAGDDGGCGVEGAFLESVDQQGFVVAVAACLGMCVFSPMIHYLMFYAFFHSVCLGCAELWGYPDRNIYGPWWLVMDDVRDYFRLWSAPVHRWLSKTIQRPMIDRGQSEAIRLGRRRAGREEKENSRGGGGVSSATGRSGGGRGKGGGGGGGGSMIITRWWFASVVCSFLVSGVVHEAVAFVAMRRTFWPFNTLFLAVSASMTPFWDALFPVIDVPVSPASSSPPSSPSSPTVTGAGGVKISVEAAATVAATATPSPRRSAGRNKKPRPKIGSWRGWAAVVFYASASVPLTLAVDYLVWQWWRHAHSIG